MAVISIKTVYQRITLNKITLAFFLFSIFHFMVQVILYSLLYAVESDHSILLGRIIREADMPHREIPFLTSNSGELKVQVCSEIPYGTMDGFCTTVFDSSQSNLSIPIPAGFRRLTGEPRLHRRSIIEPAYNSSGQISGINLSTDNRATLFLDNQCTRLLLYPNEMFRAFVRENQILIAAYFWLLCMSCFIVVYESRAHVLAVTITRLLITSWSAYAIHRNNLIAYHYSRIMTSADSPCGVDLFPTFFRTSTAYQISILVVDSLGLVLSVFLLFRLTKIYRVQTFKSICPPKGIVPIYRIFLSFYACSQLSLFSLLAAMSLWIGELINAPVGETATSSTIYHGLFITITCLLVPWIIIGWIAARRELQIWMAIFIGLGLFFIMSWAVMLYSPLFRWVFAGWPFFASLTVSAFVEMVGSCVLGVICWRNFNKGLAQYLYAEEILDKDNFHPGVFTHDDVEADKASFSSSSHMLEFGRGTKLVLGTDAILL